MKPTAISPNLLKKNQQNAKKKAFKRASRRAAESMGMGSSKEIHGHVPSIELFQREDCPFSHAVRNRMTRLGLDFVAHTVPAGDPLKHDRLVKAGGKDQIPFLIDHTSGVKLYDTQAIVSYLDKAYGKEEESMLGRLAHGLDTRIRSRADQIAWTLRFPYEKITSLREDLEGAVGTMRGSLDFIRSRLDEAVRTSTKRESGAAAAMKPESVRRSATVRANVASATEAA